VKNVFGEVEFALTEHNSRELIFLPRHGWVHTTPAHKVNFRAIMLALYEMQVERIMASYAVGSINESIEPGSLVAIDQLIDFTDGRDGSFSEGGDFGLAHATHVTEPYCANLRELAVEMAPLHGIEVRNGGTYVAARGPRFETAAEIRMFGILGGDVVGMTAAPETFLARELSIHYGAVAISVNYASGIKGSFELDYAILKEKRESLLSLFMDVLYADFSQQCPCATSAGWRYLPKNWIWRGPMNRRKID
jgi:5'-methylthioadenosine phosphorylase